MSMKICDTAREVIAAIGGPAAFADWYGTSEDNAYAWSRRGFPSNTYVAMHHRLRTEKEIDAPASAWGMVDVPPGAERTVAPSRVSP